MKFFKTLTALTVLTSLAIGLAPKAAFCQMGNSAKISCKMSCCKKAQQAPASCPLIKPEAPRDVLVTASVKLVPELKVIATLALSDFVVSLTKSASLYIEPQIPKDQFYRTPQTGPAPPPLA